MGNIAYLRARELQRQSWEFAKEGKTPKIPNVLGKVTFVTTTTTMLMLPIVNAMSFAFVSIYTYIQRSVKLTYIDSALKYILALEMFSLFSHFIVLFGLGRLLIERVHTK